jgi:predicted NUDIX family NTP pyrophosphohydrolase
MPIPLLGGVRGGSTSHKVTHHVKEYPEIDKAGWFGIDQAKKKILKGQVGFIDRLVEIINYVPQREDSERTDIPEQGSLF